MAGEYDQEAFWDSALFNLQTAASIEFIGTYPTVPLDPIFSVSIPPFWCLVFCPNIVSVKISETNRSQFEDPTSKTNSNAVSEAAGEPSTGWYGQTGIWPSTDSNQYPVESPPSNERPERPKKMLIEPQPHIKRRTRKPPSGQALERRRQQNRAAQLAFRERSKKQVEEMRQELIQCVEYNQKMYLTMQELLERTESLKKDIESALALQPPVNSLEASHASRTNGWDLFASPTSSNGSPEFDYDGGSN